LCETPGGIAVIAVALLMLLLEQEPKSVRELIQDIDASGRVLSLVPESVDRIRIAPGAPPLLAFRSLEGRERGRFGGLDLVLDDAGH
jgi:hypothetical protein